MSSEGHDSEVIIGDSSSIFDSSISSDHESTSSTDHRRVTRSSCWALKSAVATLYRLDDFYCESIGTGFFSEVFKVTHKVTGEVMVLKMNLLRSNRPNMLKEVQVMNQLSHPNILGYVGVCVHEGQLHALTEYINGGRLEQIIQNRSIPFSYSVRMKLALDIARGMEYLHSKDIFHRDLTSKNVLVKTSESGDMTAVVGDFGLAAKIPSRKMFRCGYRLATVGSAYWMSPECLKGEWYDETSDIFSYGIILCEMIARVDADPDILLRTENFGLDYIAFTSLCSNSTLPPPSPFIKLAFTCCNYDSKSRPTFADIVMILERLLAENSDSEEKDSCEEKSREHHKLCHKRSFSYDGIRMLGETMAKQDVHYKPANLNPFIHIAPLKGRKKIVNHSSSETTWNENGNEVGGVVVVEPVVKPSEVLQSLREQPSSDQPPLLDSIFAAATSRSGIMQEQHFSSSDSKEEDLVEGGGDGSSSGGGVGSRRVVLMRTSLPPSLPSSPTFGRRANCTTPNKPNPRALFKPIRTCSSGSNLVSLEDHTTVLRRRGSCESGFFSSVGEDFCTPGLELVASSSVTLSSSSAASSLSHTYCESLTDGLTRHVPRRHAKRTSSVYTDSSEDIPTLDSDPQGPQQITKMVEYFERKQTTEPKDYYRHLRSTYESRGGITGIHLGSCGSSGVGALLCVGGDRETSRSSPSQLISISSAAALKRVSHRLRLCEGAVSSKLQIFDKK